MQIHRALMAPDGPAFDAPQDTPLLLSAQNAGGKVNVGWIGAGTRGMHVMKMMYQAVPESVVISGVCDTYAGNLAKGKDQIQTMGKNTPKTYIDYKELLADKSIDAVFIATPEHLHHEMTIAALRAGKNIYVEKPLAHTIEEGQDIVREAKKAGKVVQVGTPRELVESPADAYVERLLDTPRRQARRFEVLAGRHDA